MVRGFFFLLHPMTNADNTHSKTTKQQFIPLFFLAKFMTAMLTLLAFCTDNRFTIGAAFAFCWFAFFSEGEFNYVPAQYKRNQD